jgi:hypothetical protein
VGDDKCLKTFAKGPESDILFERSRRGWEGNIEMGIYQTVSRYGMHSLSEKFVRNRLVLL